ncbi:MAG: Gfo/Idh/MocA family oxidoreductase [Acidobacteria bacterium]|nr:Gfo/Idh/MocA family oxidoreductase [Acidobacteriota bacterium]
MGNIAVVGNGYWGRNLVRNFHELGALGIVCDGNPDVEASVLEKYPDVRFTRDYSEVLELSGIDAVVLATPAATHFEMARRALLAGKDVFVEKPLALRATDGADLVDLAARKGRILMVGHILQYHPAVLKLKELITSGTLGRVQYMYSNRLNIGKIRTEENILWSFAPHDISVILSLLGEEPTEVRCTGGSHLNQGVADVTLTDLAFPSGARAHIFVSWLHPFKEQRLVVVGSEKMVVFDDAAANKLVIYPHRVEWKNRIPTAVKADGCPVALKSVEPLKEECRAFLNAIEKRQNPVTDGHEGLRVLRLLNACQESLESGRTIMPARKLAMATGAEQSWFAHPTAIVAEGAQLGQGTKVWHFSHIMKGAQIGEKCIFGQNCHIAGDVTIGNNVKVQNNVSIYTGAIIEDDVFLGPSCVLTNVTNPRSQVNRHSLYERTIFRRGTTVGANSTIVCGIELGRYSFVAAGAVVTKNVPDYALVMGTPAHQVGWMSRHGHRLENPDAEGIMVCPESGYRYKEVSPGILRCLDLDENAVLPPQLATGNKAYDDFKIKVA